MKVLPTDKAINKLQQFYAAEKYRQLIADGISELDAHLTVSKLLGHERADVTNIYLTSTQNKILWFESGFC